jgi:hypothetical protein
MTVTLNVQEDTLLKKKAGDEAPRPDSVTGISYSSKPKVATGALCISLPSFFSLYVGVSNETHACLCKWLKFVPPSLSNYVKSLHRPWYRCLLMVVDPAPSLRGTAGHSSIPPLRLVRRRPCECRSHVERNWLGRKPSDAPRADVLIEGLGSLQRGEGRAAMWSEERSRSEGTGDGRRGRHSDARAAATRGMEEHVRRTYSACSSPYSRPMH